MANEVIIMIIYLKVLKDLYEILDIDSSANQAEIK